MRHFRDVVVSNTVGYLPVIYVTSGSRKRPLSVQGRAKLMELSLVTHIPSRPIGYALAGHFAWQK